MPRLITAAERIVRARALIQEAREYPVPLRGGKYDLSYMAQVRDLLRQAKDLVKFIPSTVGAAPEIKSEAKQIITEAEQAGREIFKG
jgi:ABC-type arginine transport system ATPase subunit